MTKIRTIAKAGGWEVAQDVNGIISIAFGNGQWICDHGSAYEAIRNEVSDPEVRAELLRQWALDHDIVRRAEEATPVVEAVLEKKMGVVEELGS